MFYTDKFFRIAATFCPSSCILCFCSNNEKRGSMTTAISSAISTCYLTLILNHIKKDSVDVFGRTIATASSTAFPCKWTTVFLRIIPEIYSQYKWSGKFETYILKHPQSFKFTVRKSMRFPSKIKGKNQEICRAVM